MAFRRWREPLHERLAREGGMPLEWSPLYKPSLPWGEVGIHGVHRAREWDAVVLAAAPGVSGDELAFVALPDGSLLVEDEAGDADLSPLADAVEQDLDPPYRARAVRRDGGLWAVSAKRIRVERLALTGDELTLTMREGERELVADGERVFGSERELEALAGGESYVVNASRLDGDLFEVTVSAL